MLATPETWVPDPPGPPSTLQDRFMDLEALGVKIIFVSYDPTLKVASTPVPDGGNTGDGTLTILMVLSAGIAETWTLTCKADTSKFTVVGSVSGAKADLTVNTYYSNTFFSGYISTGDEAFVTGDEFTFNIALIDAEGPVIADGYSEYYREDTANLVEVIYTK